MDPFVDIIEIIERQQELNNTNDRFNKNVLINTISYCVEVARLMIEQVLNKSYYPLATDEDIETITKLNIKEVVLNLLFPYFKDSTFIKEAQKQSQKLVEELEADHYLLYLREDDNLYNNVLRYLNYTFLNII